MLQSLMGKRGLLLAVTALALAALSGCANFPGTGNPTPTSTSPQPAATSTTSTLYYDFPDVPIPNELSLVRDDSQVFQGSSFKSGVLAFKGRVDQGSLIGFFTTAMAKDNWKLLGSIRHRRSALMFQKPDRLCMITIYEKIYYTHVEIHLMPTAVNQ